MNEAIGQMLAKYTAKSQEDYQNALKEILQEIILLGLDRADFFERAAFYGGTALRILHSLDRFSEDLDFTLLKPDPHFSFEKYFSILSRELKAYGFEVALSRVEKNADRLAESAFLKVNTQIMFLNIEGARSFAANVQKNQLLKIKFEVDVEPATSFTSETKTLLLPSPFTVKALTLPCLFAGKMHAVLFRKWKQRVKGRDFYDLVWYLARKVPLNRTYLQEKIQGTQELLKPLTKALLLELFQDRVRSVDWSKAKQDVYPFIKDRKQVDLWSAEFFMNMIDSVEFEK
jgi:predicted nucleotidyltransferase component of viral defense system